MPIIARLKRPRGNVSGLTVSLTVAVLLACSEQAPSVDGASAGASSSGAAPGTAGALGTAAGAGATFGGPSSGGSSGATTGPAASRPGRVLPPEGRRATAAARNRSRRSRPRPPGSAALGAGAAAFSGLDYTSNAYSDHKKGPPPRENPPGAMATPKNGAMPTSHGFAFDIEGDQLTWGWGPSIIKAEEPTLEMYCSDDGAQTFLKVVASGGKAKIPCSSRSYTSFFRYKNPGLINTNPASVWVYTGYFTIEGERVDVTAYPPFTDGSANWTRFRHPISADGVTAAIWDAQHNNDELKHLDRYASGSTTPPVRSRSASRSAATCCAWSR